MEKLNDIWFRLIGIPVMALLLTLSFAMPMITIYHTSFFKVYGTYLIVTAIYVELSRLLIIIARKKYPGLEHTFQRIIFLSLILLVTVIGLSFLLYNFFSLTQFWGYSEMVADFYYYCGFYLIFIMMLAAFYESFYFFRISKESLIETEWLKKENLQSQLNALKNQINPHFLFNNLNTLRSLIDEDQERSKDFVDELSQVYRYVLMSSEKQLTTLEEELQFIRAYIYLLKTRFGKNLTEEILVPEIHLQKQLPPLTLQILVENAVKHNVITESKPLIIKIYADANDSLVVSNNLQKKTQFVPSNKVGLENIRKRYEMLGKESFKVEDVNGSFVVKVPLITHQS